MFKRLSMALAAAGLMFAASAATAAQPGDLVLGQWGDGHWYPARVAEVQGDKLLVSFYDGDVGTLPANKVKAYDWKVGSKVQCNWKRKGKYYKGTIAKMKVEWIHVKYDDGDKENTGIGRCRIK